ncbi:hypothetical protein L083_7925 [Actinoplanes sp. N902-109]|nr:hypothetical protein L083_7925 [Actinoplanes sp. N902-109]
MQHARHVEESFDRRASQSRRRRLTIIGWPGLDVPAGVSGGWFSLISEVS